MAKYKIAEADLIKKEELYNTCPICYELIFEVGGDPQDAYILKNCKCVLHKVCIEESLNAKMKNSAVEFPCPKVECQKLLPEYDLK